MTTEGCHGKNGDEDWHANGDARSEGETLPKESDPLQPKSLKLKATKEVKEVSFNMRVVLFHVTIDYLESILQRTLVVSVTPERRRETWAQKTEFLLAVIG